MQGYYNSIAKGYNQLHGDEQQRKLQIIKELFKPKSTEIYLDVGCGTGISSEWDCQVFGLDPNIELLKRSRKLKVQGIGELLPFMDDTFDNVICLTAIHNFDDPIKGLREIKRVSKRDVVISILKMSVRLNEIRDEIEREFVIQNIIEEEKDFIFILSKF